MQAPPEFGFQQLISELLRGLADAVADRPGQTEAQRFARHQAAIFSVMALLPRDVMETLLAGQFIMFDHLLRDAVSDLLRSEAAPGKFRVRSQAIALGRLFHQRLEQFLRLRARAEQQPAAASRAEPALSPNPTAIPEPVRQPSAAAPVATVVRPARADAEPQTHSSSLQEAPPPIDKVARLQQRGFQNRRMRRALRFKPAGKAASGRSVLVAPAASSGL